MKNSSFSEKKRKVSFEKLKMIKVRLRSRFSATAGLPRVFWNCRDENLVAVFMTTSIDGEITMIRSTVSRAPSSVTPIIVSVNIMSKHEVPWFATASAALSCGSELPIEGF